jgi:hypothetical protein
MYASNASGCGASERGARASGRRMRNDWRISAEADKLPSAAGLSNYTLFDL